MWPDSTHFNLLSKDLTPIFLQLKTFSFLQPISLIRIQPTFSTAASFDGFSHIFLPFISEFHASFRLRSFLSFDRTLVHTISNLPLLSFFQYRYTLLNSIPINSFVGFLTVNFIPRIALSDFFNIPLSFSQTLFFTFI